MKTIKRIAMSISLLLVMIITVACSSGGAKYDTYVLEKDGGIATVKLYHDSKEVSKLDSEMILPYAALGMNASQKEEMKQSFEIAQTMLKSINGLEVKIDFGDEKVTLNMVIDYSKIDINQIQNLSKLGGGSLPFEDLEKMKDFEKAEKNLLDAGFVKK